MRIWPIHIAVFVLLAGAALVFADVYNLFDNQDTLLIEEGYNHPFGYADTSVILKPRRWEVGV
jgi:hypothetical protein